MRHIKDEQNEARLGVWFILTDQQSICALMSLVNDHRNTVETDLDLHYRHVIFLGVPQVQCGHKFNLFVDHIWCGKCSTFSTSV